MSGLVEIGRRKLNVLTDRIFTLPLLVLMPHSRCNCRCVMCDIWKANDQKRELSVADLEPHLEAIARLGVRRVVLSGGEALMHDNLFVLAERLHAMGASITLLSTGLLLERYAAEVARWCDEVTVSLDGPREVHDAIRNVPRAFERLESGVGALRAQRAGLRITGRSVIQRLNFAGLVETIDAARSLGLDELSFLPVDVSTEAFNRPGRWGAERVAENALSRAEVEAFRGVVERVITERCADLESGFVVHTPEALRRFAAYFAALNGDGDFPPVRCNAPWVSAVIEPDGDVRPCFFHAPFGNLHRDPLDAILGSAQAVRFRAALDVSQDPICKRCVCTLYIGPRTAV